MHPDTLSESGRWLMGLQGQGTGVGKLTIVMSSWTGRKGAALVAVHLTS